MIYIVIALFVLAIALPGLGVWLDKREHRRQADLDRPEDPS